MDNDDIDNIRAIIIRSNNGSLDEWLETLNDGELHYALTILQNLIASREAFVQSI
jgi:hypothetical protein